MHHKYLQNHHKLQKLLPSPNAVFVKTNKETTCEVIIKMDVENKI